jgi:hypothetical protein
MSINIKLNPEIKTKGLAALRSGGYKQTKRVLQDKMGFCCLGVLCDIHRQETQGPAWIDDESDEGQYCQGYLHEVSILPREVAEWAGLDKNINPLVNKEGEGLGYTTLAELNDRGTPFNQLADIIEKQL